MTKERTTALDTALAALRHRDLSAAELDRRLASRGFDESEREEAAEALRRTGVLDDRRFAESRATALAGRGAGDALIRHDLERVGLDADEIEDALKLLPSEAERAGRVVARRGPGPKTARYLAQKGFSEDAVAVALHGAALPETP